MAVGNRLPGDCRPPGGAGLVANAEFDVVAAAARKGRAQDGSNIGPVARMDEGQRIIGHRQAFGDAIAGHAFDGRIDPVDAAVLGKPGFPVIGVVGDDLEQIVALIHATWFLICTRAGMPAAALSIRQYP